MVMLLASGHIACSTGAPGGYGRGNRRSEGRCGRGLPKPEASGVDQSDEELKAKRKRKLGMLPTLNDAT